MTANGIRGDLSKKTVFSTNNNSQMALADIIIIAVPMNYDPDMNYFDCSIVDTVVDEVTRCSDCSNIVIKSTVPVGYTESVNKRLEDHRVIFSPEFLRESRALYDNLYPSRIIVGACEELKLSAEQFAGLLSSASEKKDVEVLLMGSKEAEAVMLEGRNGNGVCKAHFMRVME